MTQPSLLACRLHAARVAVGVPRERAALQVGKSWSTIRAYESGAVTPPTRTLAALAQMYGVTVDSLIDAAVSHVA